MNISDKKTQHNESTPSAPISWTPIVKGGHNYKAHQLTIESQNRLTIKATPTHLLALSLFTGMSLFFISQTGHLLLEPRNGETFDFLFPLISLVFFFTGCR